MEIYNEEMELIEDPDLELGYLKDSTRIVHHEAVEGVEEEWHYEVIAEYPNGGKDVEKVIDVEGVEASEAWDEEVPIKLYIPYTEEELAQIEAEKNKPSPEDRIKALEEQNEMLTECLLEMSVIVYG